MPRRKVLRAFGVFLFLVHTNNCLRPPNSNNTYTPNNNAPQWVIAKETTKFLIDDTTIGVKYHACR